jgi:glycosyltransferase involved in cell wall biosynthesis
MSEYKFSLIVATLNRGPELEVLLESLVNQTFPTSLFEVVIVDQNNSDLILPIVSAYSQRISINHIKSPQKGLSYNRNIGIQASKGEYLCVPDDDCTYYPDTLQAVFNQLEFWQMPDMVIGKVFDRESGKYIFKKTPDKSIIVNKSNFYHLVSSITIFFKKSEIMFDENFGIGATYPSNEDGDFILTFLSNNKRVIYSPLIDCNHPPYSAENMSRQKLFDYGIGFGAMCRKHMSLNMLILFFKVFAFQFLMILRYLILLDKENITRRWKSLSGRCAGFINYRFFDSGS